MVALSYEKRLERSCWSANTMKKWRHQVLKTFSFDHGPSCILELSGSRIAVGVGNTIEVFDLEAEAS
jgi:hypothetical protein